MSKQSTKRGREGGEERKDGAPASAGVTSSSSSSSSSTGQPAAAAATAGHKRSPTAALVDSSSGICGATRERAAKKSKGNGAASEADAAAASSSSPAAAAASSSSSSPASKLQPRPSFLHPVRELFAELVPLAQSLLAQRRSSLNSAAESLEVAREALRQLQVEILGAPELQQELQPQIKALQRADQVLEAHLVEVKAKMEEDERRLRSSLERAQGELSAGQLAVALAENIENWRPKYDARKMSLESQMQQRRWEVRAGLLLEQLASTLTADEIRSTPLAISTCAKTGLLSVVQRMLQVTGAACTIESDKGHPYLSLLAADSRQHFVSLMPLMHFIRYGLDPTLTSNEYPRSALQMAREHVQSHPLTSPAAKRELQEELEKCGCGSCSGTSGPQDFAMDYATHRMAETLEDERARLLALHTRFMHALVAVWRAHSSHVRALLEEPLIPDLANICAEYLDLEPVEKRQQ